MTSKIQLLPRFYPLAIISIFWASLKLKVLRRLCEGVGGWQWERNRTDTFLPSVAHVTPKPKPSRLNISFVSRPRRLKLVSGKRSTSYSRLYFEYPVRSLAFATSIKNIEPYLSPRKWWIRSRLGEHELKASQIKFFLRNKIHLQSLLIWTVSTYSFG